MKNIKQTKTSLRAPLMIGGLIVLIIIVSVLTYVLAFGGNFMGWTTSSQKTDSSSQPFDTNPPTDEQTKAGINIKTKTNDKTDNINTSLTVTLSALNQTNSLLQIRVIADTISDTGKCTLALTKGSSVITKTATLQALPSTSTCKGFDIAKSELSKGEWQITVNITVGTLSGTVKKSVEIQ